MPWERRAAPACQQGKSIAQCCGYVFNPKDGGPGRRELDGERYAVEVTADFCNRRQAFGV
jgi:hypothetical protein